MPDDFGSRSAGKKGGEARAKRLSKADRREIARRGAAARWHKELPRATHTGELQLGNASVDAAVLKGGERVLSQRGLAKALGAAKPSTMISSGADKLPAFLGAANLKPFISNDITAPENYIEYVPEYGGRTAYGMKAEVIPKICNVWLQARDAGVLRYNQRHLAEAAEIIIRGLSEVGIVALVDEATGYQDERARDALAKILEAFVAKELRKWVKTFPLDYFRELCRLKQVPFRADMKLPPYFGHLTNDIVYSRLAPGVLRELQRKNPKDHTGRRKAKYFQYLTEDIGHPKLLQHLHAVIALMRVSPSGGYDDFKLLLDQALPVHVPAPLFEDLGDDEKEVIREQD